MGSPHVCKCAEQVEELRRQLAAMTEDRNLWQEEHNEAASNALQWHPCDGDTKCQCCGRSNPCWFTDNATWRHVVKEVSGVLCASCFIAKADKLGIAPTGWVLIPAEDYEALQWWQITPENPPVKDMLVCGWRKGFNGVMFWDVAAVDAAEARMPFDYWDGYTHMAKFIPPVQTPEAEHE